MIFYEHDPFYYEETHTIPTIVSQNKIFTMCPSVFCKSIYWYINSNFFMLTNLILDLVTNAIQTYQAVNINNQ